MVAVVVGWDRYMRVLHSRFPAIHYHPGTLQLVGLWPSAFGRGVTVCRRSRDGIEGEQQPSTEGSLTYPQIGGSVSQRASENSWVLAVPISREF